MKKSLSNCYLSGVFLFCMNQFQNVSFRSFNDFLDYLPDDELKMVEQLRKLIFSCIADAREKLAYNVPFYYRYSRICFIWPAAVPWGKPKKKGVELGFCKGFLLPDPSYLTAGGRKEMYFKTFHTVKDIDADMVRQLLYEAVVIDEEAAMQRKKGNKRSY